MEINQVKETIAKKKIVEFKGIQYYPVAYKLWVNERDNAWAHSIELRDLKSNCIVVAPLKLVKIIEGKVFDNGRIKEI